MTTSWDVVVVGGGHNGLVAAAYLARAGLTVCVLERDDHVGGAAISHRAFSGVDVRLSRYSYLVSLLPDQIVTDLGLDLTIVPRAVASYTPVRHDGTDSGLLVEQDEGPATEASFRDLTGGDEEFRAWQAFYADAATLANAVAPTMLEPLHHPADVRARMGSRVWDWLVSHPLGEIVERTFRDDTVRGVVMTDALIGTFASAHDVSLAQNRCFLYHVIGNGTGEWRVPVGGMGAVTAALEAAARAAGAVIRTGAEVLAVEADGVAAEVRFRAGDGEETAAARFVLANVAPAVLDRLRGSRAAVAPEGAQLKVNMVLSRLPRLRSGADPRIAFAGMFHIDEGYADLESGYADAVAGRMPDPLPSEVYCHTLSDRSILGPDLDAAGAHTLTLFGLHTPARLFAADNGAAREDALSAAVRGLEAFLAEPLADCLFLDGEGRPCIEAVTPLDLEATVSLPGGHIFHGDLSWPWAEGPEQVGSWGVETDTANVLLCGAGARRGGGVSGIAGHNAAQRVLASEAARRPTG